MLFMSFPFSYSEMVGLVLQQIQWQEDTKNTAVSRDLKGKSIVDISGFSKNGKLK